MADDLERLTGYLYEIGLLKRFRRLPGQFVIRSASSHVLLKQKILVKLKRR